MRNTALNKSISDYEIDMNMVPTRRAADFLNWCAVEFPGRPIQHNILLKVAGAMPKAPREDSKEVEAFRKGKMGTVKAILLRSYKRGVLHVPGMGVRATTNSEDAMKCVEAANRRVVSSVRKLDEARTIVDKKEIRNPELKARLSRIDEGMAELPGLMLRLELPPAPAHGPPGEAGTGVAKRGNVTRRPIPVNGDEEEEDTRGH